MAMSSFRFLIALVLPFLVACYNTQLGEFNIDTTTLIYRGIYMYTKQDSPKVKKNGKSEITIDINVRPQNDTTPLYGTVETVVVTEDVFKNIGYIDNKGNRIGCCDEDAYRRDKCKNLNTLLLPHGSEGKYKMEKTILSGNEASIKMTYVPPETGIYYLVTAVCDYHVSPLVMKGKLVVENPHGHLPAPQYGSLPFYSVMCVMYVVALFVWILWCVKYSSEVMSVQIIVLIVLVSFVIDYIIKVIYLTVYNNSGSNPFVLALISIAIDCTTRTLTRVLTLVVCMGLGICRATLSTSVVRFIMFGIAYYIVSVWDAYSTMFPVEESKLEFVRLFITSGMDALVYFWIFQSLMDTMDELTDRKQDAKLAIFTKLRNLLVVSVIVATITLIIFSYIIVADYTKNVWKFQWLYVSSEFLINDGIWSVYYFLLFFFIMMMWRPSENSSAYAEHIQIATNAEADDDGYGLPAESLVDPEANDSAVVVNTVDSEMKPMNMSETVTGA